jgi:hypothetical protein
MLCEGHQVQFLVAIAFVIRSAQNQARNAGTSSTSLQYTRDWPMPGNIPFCLSKGGIRMLGQTDD